MVDDAIVNQVPVMTGGRGKNALLAVYARDFIPRMPSDTTLIPVSRTVAENQLVDEMIFSFTHTAEMPWMLPGIAPTSEIRSLGDPAQQASGTGQQNVFPYHS